MNRLAVLILTYNEENHIEKCIDSAAFADEIVVLDSGSTDRTVELAQKKGAKVITHPMNQDFAAQRNFALTCSDAEWVLYLDADERITTELAMEIKNIVRDTGTCSYSIARKFIMYGKWMRYGGLYPDYVLRLFPKQAGLVWQGAIHESAHVNIPVTKLQNALEHHGFKGWEKHMNKDNWYTTMLATKLYNKGKRSNVISIIFRPMWAFIRMYFLRFGWRDGLLGFALACFRYNYVLMKYVKLFFYEKDRESADERAYRVEL